MKLTGKLLTKGEILPNGDIIPEDCRIDFSKIKGSPLTWQFDHLNPIGTVLSCDIGESGKDITVVAKIEKREIKDFNKWQKTY